MSPNFFENMSSKAFNVIAFSIFGLLFIAKPTTLVPTLILLLASLAILVQASFRQCFIRVFIASPYKWIARAIFVWFCVALFLAIIHHSQEKFYFPDNALRMVMALTLFAMVAKQRGMQWFLFGVALACLADIYWALKAWPWNIESRPQGTTNNAIHFGNLSAIAMMLSITAALIAPKLLFKTRILFFLATLGGFAGAVASLSRSSFVVLLCLFPLVFLTTNTSMSRWLRRGAALSVMAISVAVLMLPTARDRLRITEAVVDVQQLQEGNYMTSIGARAVMWQTAWQLFNEHPLLGVGVGQFQTEILRRIEKGEIPNTGTYNQPHSDIMHALSSGGLLKFLSYLGILVAPFAFFYQRFCTADISAEMRLASILGMQVVAAYFLTGLTNSNFDLQIYSTTYAVLVCVLAKLSWQAESA